MEDVFVTTDGFTLIGRVVQLLTNALKTTISNSLLTKALQELVLCFMALAGIPRPPVMLICKRKSYRGIHRIFIRPFFAHITIQPMGNPRMKLGFWITNLFFLMLVTFRIPRAGVWIPKLRSPDSRIENFAPWIRESKTVLDSSFGHAEDSG